MSQPLIKTVQTPLLDIAYEEHGATEGQPVVLLHGWPDDPRTWDGVAPQLAQRGFRVIVPYLRGFGPTRFLDFATKRSGQVTALAQDYVDLLDALKIEKSILVGHDWGGRTGYVAAALFPQRVKHLVAISVAYQPTMPSGDQIRIEQVHHYFYQWFLHSERAREHLSAKRKDFCGYLWKQWAPGWAFTEAELNATSISWMNLDWINVTIHSYRDRWHAIERDPRYESLEKRLIALPTIHVPTTVLHGEDDGASLVSGSADQQHYFDGPYSREVLADCGHFVPREKPQRILEAVLRIK